MGLALTCPKWFLDATQIRSAKLGSLPLTSMSLLHQQAQSPVGHPIVLSGSYDNQVNALTTPSPPLPFIESKFQVKHA